MTFDTLGAMRKLRDRGAEEPLAEGIVEVVTDATGELVTREHFDERMVADREYYDARWVADREYYDARWGRAPESPSTRSGPQTESPSMCSG